MNHADLEQMAEVLERSGNYRVLRKLEAPSLSKTQTNSDDRLAVFVDVETTGLDPSKDEVIEVALLQFRYSADGNVSELVEVFDQLRQPSFAIPETVISITGITNELVAGRQIDLKALESIVAPVSLVVAHNAQFDRRFLERLFPIFASKPWACSMSEIDWSAEGFEGTKLSYLASEAGFFYDRHRAENDCFAGIELLRRALPKSGSSGMAALLNRARRTTWRIWAEGAPFECKEALKARGYRWNGEGGGKPRAWYLDVSEEGKAAELTFLRDQIYRGDRQLRVSKITALERHSDRV